MKNLRVQKIKNDVVVYLKDENGQWVKISETFNLMGDFDIQFYIPEEEEDEGVSPSWSKAQGFDPCISGSNPLALSKQKEYDEKIISN